MERGLISLAEWLQSVAHLAPADAEALHSLRVALQFGPGRVRAEPPPALAPPPAPPPPAPPAPPLPTLVNPEHLAPALPSKLHASLEAPAGHPAGEHVEMLPEEEDELEEPPYEPLFSRLQQAAILSTALATRAGEGAVALEKVLEPLTAGRPALRLPRRPVPTLRRGLQLLVDVGQGMTPYARDRAELMRAVQHLVGSEKVEVKAFIGCPSWGVGRGPRHEWAAWRPPRRGIPVVLLSDLGIGEPPLALERAYPAEWLRFGARVRRAGCPLVALVPYERRRWPAALERDMALIPWDRTTTVQAARQAVGCRREEER